VHGEGAKAVPHFHEAAITANGHGNGSHGDANSEPDPVVVAATPVAQPAAAEGPGQPEPGAQWPPPAWPPGDPPAGAPEGPGPS
jgi:hypothetical protein